MLSYRKAMHNRRRVLKNFGCYEMITFIKLTKQFHMINGKILVKLKQDKGCSCLTGSIHKTKAKFFQVSNYFLFQVEVRSGSLMTIGLTFIKNIKCWKCFVWILNVHDLSYLYDNFCLKILILTCLDILGGRGSIINIVIFYTLSITDCSEPPWHCSMPRDTQWGKSTWLCN